MKHRYTHINIDHFFRSLDRLEPLYNENKVHQLINTPETTARLKGKHFKPLKIILMTSLFVSIVAAILLWTGNEPVQPEMLKNAEQIQIVENNINTKLEDETKNVSHTNAEKLVEEPIEILEVKQEEILNTNSNKNGHEANDKVSKKTYAALAKTDSIQESKSQTPPTTIKGDIKMVVANQKLLEKLGFQFNDQSVYYKNRWGKKETEQATYIFDIDKEGHTTYFLSHNSNIQDIDRIAWTKNDFYPVAEAYRSGELKSHFLSTKDLEMANDTLFPIYCPQGLVRQEPNDIIFWFHITDNFIQQLPIDKQQYAHKLQQCKIIKKLYPDVNLIDYTQNALVDSSKFIELTVPELLNFGFSIQIVPDHIQTKDGYKNTSLLCYWMIKDSASVVIKYAKWGSSNSHKEYLEQYRKNPNLTFVTNINGIFEYKVENKDLTDTRNLIPILVREEQFSDAVDKDRVYWFSLSDKLFNALPKHISTDLQKEYNYIIAENKSEMVKPECVYFEECKNTLLISNFKVFPNPANQQTTVTFSLPKAINGRISLVDLAGRERQVLLPETNLSKGFQRFEFDLSGVSEGMYLITLYSDEGVQIQRLMVTH
ncbi:MAG: T9SS type A sorting domain-containing protein [Prolixibacteraceae bacterium]